MNSQPPVYIAHLADIHIGSTEGRSAEYRSVFDKLFVELAAQQSKSPATPILVAIAGDIFHNKIKYSGADVDDFHYLMNGLRTYPVIMIPGNHDVNVHNPAQTDLLTPLVRDYTNVSYWRTSGWYNLHGLDFYHLNVFDAEKITPQEIGTLFDISADKLKETIFLYHGMINGAKFSNNTVMDSKIPTNILNRVKLFIAGDIHQHQFLTSTAAYSGSLIQQNIAESLEKGFIMWDLSTRTGSFVRLENTHGFIRFDLRGKTQTQAAQEIAQLSNNHLEHIHKVAVITDAAEDVSREQIEQIREKTGRIDRISRIEAKPQVINAAKDVTEALTDLLHKSGAPAEQIAAILDMHTSKSIEYECKKWYVTRLAFDYMFKYGKGNVIDFTKFEGVSGVIAPNCAGKSSIIDILVFGLFGEHLRTDNKNMIRHGANKSYVRVNFNVNGVDHYVERSYVRGDHRATIKLCKRGEPNAATWTNITGPTVDSMNKTISQLIGSLNQFLATGLYYDSQNDVLRTPPADRMRLMTMLLGIVDNSSIIKELKNTEKTIKAKINQLVKPRLEHPQDDYDAIEDQLLDLITKRDATRNELAQIEAKYRDISLQAAQLRHHSIVAGELAAARDDLSRVTAKHSRLVIEREVKYAEPLTLGPGEQAALAKTAAQQLPNAEDISRELSIVDAMLPRDALPDPKRFGLEPSISGAVDALRVKLQDIRQRPRPTVQPCESGAALEAQLCGLKTRPIDTKYIESIRVKILKLQANSALRFNAGCECCSANKQSLAQDLAAGERELASAEAFAAQTREENARITDKINILTEQLVQIKRISADNNLARDLEAAESKLQLELHAKENELGKLRADIELFNSHQQSAARLRELNVQLANARAREAARDRLACASDWTQFQLCQLRDSLYKQIQELTPKVAALEAELQLAASHQNDLAELSNLSASKIALSKAISQIDVDIGQCNAKSAALKAEISIHETYNLTYPELKQQYDKYKLYIGCLDSPQLRAAIISKNITKIIKRCNDNLQSVAPFKLTHVLTDKSLDFYIEEHDGDIITHSIPIASASGFQRFIISIALRLALTSITPASSDFIIIDEGFGCMDSKNIAKLSELFTAITTDFRFTFIISHVDDLQSIITNPLYIATTPDADIKQYCSSVSNVRSASGDREGDLRTDGLRPTDQPLSAACAPVNQPLTTPVFNAPPVEGRAKEPKQIACTCGRVVTQKSYTSHLKSALHAKRLQSLSNN